MITVPNRRIVDSGGNTSPEMQVWLNQVTNLQIIVGTGSPEGVVTAEVGVLFLDTAAGTGSLLYVKRDGDITKDRSKGWILV